MAKTTIEITGTIGKNIKVNPDGTAEVLMKNTMSVAVPKGLKTLGASNYLIQFGVKTWKKLSKQLTDETFVRISGEPKASVTKGGVPYIHVVAFNALVIDLSEPAQTVAKEPRKNMTDEAGTLNESSREQSVSPVVASSTQEIDKSQAEEIAVFKPSEATEGADTQTTEQVKWFEHPTIVSNLVKLDISKVVLTEKEHLKTKLPPKYISRKSSDKLTMVVRPLEDGTYSLTIGFVNLIIAKLYNIPVSAFVFTGNKEQLAETFNISF